VGSSLKGGDGRDSLGNMRFFASKKEDRRPTRVLKQREGRGKALFVAKRGKKEGSRSIVPVKNHLILAPEEKRDMCVQGRNTWEKRNHYAHRISFQKRGGCLFTQKQGKKGRNSFGRKKRRVLSAHASTL